MQGYPTLADRAGTRNFEIARIEADAPWRWVAKGWTDMWVMPPVSFAYGLFFFIVSLSLTWAMFSFWSASIVLAAAAGFMLVGPVLATGLYETSRRVAQGDRPSFRIAFRALAGHSSQVRFMGILLMFMMLAWLRVAMTLFALFFGTEYPPLGDFVRMIFFTPEGLWFLTVGTAVGAVFAVIVFSMAVISIPLLMARPELDAITAMVASFDAVRTNLIPMMVWGWIIAVVMGVGIVTSYVGLIVAFPLIGHATWHAYRELMPKAE